MNLKSTKSKRTNKNQISSFFKRSMNLILNPFRKFFMYLKDSDDRKFNIMNNFALIGLSIFLWNASGFVSFMFILLAVFMLFRLSSSFVENIMIIIFAFFPILLMLMTSDFYSKSKDYNVTIKKIEVNPAKEKVIVETTLKQKPYVSFKMNSDDFYLVKDNIKKAKFKIKMECVYDTYTRLDVNTKNLDVFKNPLKSCSSIIYHPVITIDGRDYVGDEFMRIQTNTQEDKFLKLN